MGRNINLVEVSGKPEEVELLFSLKKQHKHGISHASMPSFAEHQAFVRAHPYRYWFIVQSEGADVGSAYVQSDNSIGLGFAADQFQYVGATIDAVMATVVPLPAIKSVRNGRFHIHVAAGDTGLREAVCALGGVHIQSTFLLPTDSV